MDSREPVSYTHLDVYKRQGIKIWVPDGSGKEVLRSKSGIR